MLSTSQYVTLGIFIVLYLILALLLIYLSNKRKKKQLDKIFSVILVLLLVWIVTFMWQIICVNLYGASPIYFDCFAFFASSFLPVAFLFMSLIFAKTKIAFKKKYWLLFIIPILSTILAWTNDFHHLIYVTYSINLNDTIFGGYDIVYSIYTYILFFISIIYLLRYTTKNSGFFSKQSILVAIGALIPVVVNILGRFNIIPMTVYLTPICFAFSVMFLALAIFKFKLTTVTPIALQRIVDRISDSYIILNEDNVITDFNATFLKTFNLNASNVRNVNVFYLLSNNKGESLVDKTILKNALQEVRKSSKTVYFDKEFPSFNKYFHIEINTILSNNSFLGTLVLFKDTTQHMQDMQTIKDNQDMLMEKERLASLGQLIGGIAHNLKTPIMSIAGASEGLSDLIKEYDSSIEDKEVTIQDHHDIAHDMNVWVNKIKEYTEYMSDVITAVKGQAVVMSEQDSYLFTIDELVKRVDILMRHELKNALINLKTSVQIDGNFEIKGNVNSLVQVINNMISNSIQAYGGKANQTIEFNIFKQDSNIIISIKDFAGGLPKEVSDKLFKEMVTTKGKNGTGLGLFMSYSNIRAHFNGNITVDSKLGVGTEFKISLPL